MDYKIVLVLLAVLFVAYTKLRSFIFKTKDVLSVKEDAKLKSKQDELKAEVEKLKTPVKPTDLNPEEIEVFWSKDDKK